VGEGIIPSVGVTSFRCEWPHTVGSEIMSRMNEIAKLPIESEARRKVQIALTTLAPECSAHVQWAHELIDFLPFGDNNRRLDLMDCQEYLVDLETSLTGFATALEVSGPGQLRDDHMGTYQELEPQVIVARRLATKLRAKHLET
jgi:hypothetical protein